MIEIYRRVEGKDRLIRTFNTFEELFRTPHVNETTLKEFGYKPADRVDAAYLWEDNVFEKVPYGKSDWLFRTRAVPVSRCRYICYDDFELVTPDRLIGLYRDWWDNRPRYRWGWWHHAGYKRSAWGWYRAPKTTNEKRWAHAWDNEENAPKNGFARGRRRGKQLVNLWDDVPRHNDKCWKTQTKCRKQWQKRGV